MQGLVLRIPLSALLLLQKQRLGLVVICKGEGWVFDRRQI